MLRIQGNEFLCPSSFMLGGPLVGPDLKLRRWAS